MTRNKLSAFYSARRSEFSSRLSRVTKKINLISNGRIITAILFVVLLYVGLTYYTFLYTLPFLLVAFTVMVRNHGTLFAEQEHLENLVKINQQELKALKGDLTSLDQGSKFTNAHHPYSH